MKLDRSAPAVFAIGLASGLLLAAALTALAQTPAAPRVPVPIEDLRMFAEVFGAIKGSYVEPIDDKKAISNCVAGMVSGLDGRSEFYEADAFRDLQALGPNAGVGADRKSTRLNSSHTV